MPKKIDLKGQRFGRLVVLEDTKKRNSDGNVIWKCRCDCGNIAITSRSSLIKGNTKSCGCFKREKDKERKTKHGHARDNGPTQIYRIWQAMLDRCYNSNSKIYSYYGGRGIWVTDRWRGKHGFKNFYEDIGKYRQKGLTLDRKDNNDGYYPKNCRWITPQKQAENRRDGKGYYWNEQKQKWQACITINKKQINLGYFNTKEEAHQAYLEAKKKYHKNRRCNNDKRKRKKTRTSCRSKS